MSHGFSLRQLEPADLPAISRIHWRACSVAYRFMNWAYTETQVSDWYAGKLHEWDWGRVGYAQAGVMGFLACTRSHIDQLFVDPAFQRQGLGTALLTAALLRVPGQATLHVFEANTPARALYERMGFRPTGSWLNKQEQAIELLYVHNPGPSEAARPRPDQRLHL